MRLCASISGDRGAAEDLAQETLLEAWRNAHKLRDPAGADRWLAAIARNVCLRWARRQGREAALHAAIAAQPAPAEPELELDLEREELIGLLDRALGLLPPATRDVLVHRYVHELPHAEIAARLGVSGDAVSMRITRGKVLLRTLLATEEGDAAGAGWRETRVWCSGCGRRRLLVLVEPAPGDVAFRCPSCNPEPAHASSRFPLASPAYAELVGELVRPGSILRRVAEWTVRYFGDGAGAAVACTRCGGAGRLRRYERSSPAGHTAGLAAVCDRCGDTASTSAAAIALSLPELRGLRRDHPRLRLVRATAAADTLVVRYEDPGGSAGADVVLDRATLRVAAVHR